MIVGLVCPNCNQFITSELDVEKHREEQKVLDVERTLDGKSLVQLSQIFICNKCKIVLEPPVGIRQYTEVTPLEGGQKINRNTNREWPIQTDPNWYKYSGPERRKQDRRRRSY